MKSFSFSVAFVAALLVIQAAADIEVFNDEKAFKNLLKTRPNLLILFGKSDIDAKDTLRILKDVSKDIKGVASIAYTSCETNKKLCKKLKVNPTSVELKHYNEGTFNKDYDRPVVKKSIVSFLKDPTGDVPWDEEANGKDVVHLKDEASFNKLLKKSKVGILVMFYAPWCGFCKKLKPDYSEAATEVKPNGILAAVNCDLPENTVLKRTYNITGFPTLIYFKEGKMQFQYGGEMNKASLVEWMEDPQPPKEKEAEKSWADEEDIYVTFLADDTFDSFIETHSAVLVMFYAPWCGHCKTLKPTLNSVAKTLKEENSKTIIAFVDATKDPALGQRFKVKGYPTVKFFKDGQFAWDYNERDETKILEYLRNPQDPPPTPAPKETEPQWKEEKSLVVHAESSNFASLIKTKRHALVMFYAPWCGHCKNAKPHYRDAAEHFKEDLKVTFVAVDCTQEKEVCEQYEVKGFPTILYFNFGKNPKPYEGGREKKDFIKFMTNPDDPNADKVDQKDEWRDFEGYEHINYLDDTNFDEFMKDKQRVLVLIYAPWCGHCKSMKPAYAQAAAKLNSQVPGAYLAAVDGTKSPKLSKVFAVKGYPTIKYYEKGQFKFDYESGRTTEDIVTFMKDPKQKSVSEPAASEKVDQKEEWKSVEGHENINFLDDTNFDEFMKDKQRVLVLIYAPWCGHCKSMKPAYGQAATQLKSQVPEAHLVAVDGTKSPKLSKVFAVKGYPTLKYYEKGQFKFDYDSGRTASDIVTFMKDPKQKSATPPVSEKVDQLEEWKSVEGHEHINFLDDTNFDEFIKSKSKVLVLIYAPWCGHCKAIKPAYGQAARQMKSFLPGTYLAAVDGTKSPKLMKTFAIRGYPTLKYYENGQFKFDYDSGRTADDIVNFMREPKQKTPTPPPTTTPAPAPPKKNEL